MFKTTSILVVLFMVFLTFGRFLHQCLTYTIMVYNSWSTVGRDFWAYQNSTIDAIRNLVQFVTIDEVHLQFFWT